MKQPVKLVGPGASSQDLAAALGVTPARQAAINRILGLHPKEPAQNSPARTPRPKKRRLTKPSAEN